jgi:hypothetical protein
MKFSSRVSFRRLRLRIMQPLLIRTVGTPWRPASLAAMGLLLLSLSYSTAVAAPGENWKTLLDPQLSAWEVWIGCPHQTVAGLPAGTPLSADGHAGTPLGLNDPKHVFTATVENGEPVVHISGEILGGLTTRESFSNYHLRLQFKWGEKKWEPKLTVARDSGLLYHCTGPHGAFWNAWKRCLEFQVQEHDMGDLFCLAGTGATLPVSRPVKRWTYDPAAAWQRAGGPGAVTGDVAHLPGDFEKPNGEWNVIELYTHGTSAVHVINGHVVLALRDAVTFEGPEKTPTPLSAGQIQLQSEGAEAFVRRVEIAPLADFPPEIRQAAGL